MTTPPADRVTILNDLPDDSLDALRDAFARYVADHPGSTAQLYRLDRYITMARVIDPGFRGMEHGDRHDEVWRYLLPLSPEELADLCSVTKIAPGRNAPPA